MENKIHNVLFLCTGNSARSVMAEALLDKLGGGRFKGYSAGSHPAGQVNPHTIEQLKSQGHPVDDLRSKNWDEFAAPGAPQMDLVITVCDKAAGEACPYWPGMPMTAHWGFEDPAAAQGGDEHKRAVFQRIYREIMGRVRLLVSLPLERLDRMAIQHEVRGIGKEIA